jgi:hypothetical protein
VIWVPGSSNSGGGNLELVGIGGGVDYGSEGASWELGSSSSALLSLAKVWCSGSVCDAGLSFPSLGRMCRCSLRRDEIGCLNSVRNPSLRCLFDCGAVGWISRACVRLSDNYDLNFEQCCLKFGQTVELALWVLCFVDIWGFHYFYWFSSYRLI